MVRSKRRRKTVEARRVGDVLRVSIPASMNRAAEQECVAEMVRRAELRESARRIDLAARARVLADRYRLELPANIRWVDNQTWRWGSCTPDDSSIRISSRLAREPGWVLDYVLVHEMAHLSVAGHDRRFWGLVERYPLAERARGYLIARGVEPDDQDPPDAEPVPRNGRAEPASSSPRG